MNPSNKTAKGVKTVIYTLAPLISICLLLVLWVLVAINYPTIIPTPQSVVERFYLLIEKPVSKLSVVGHIWASMKRVLTAVLISSVLGILLGLFLGWSSIFNALFSPIFEMLRPIPPIAWVPLITLWFGIGETPKIILCFIGSFVPVVINTFTAVRMVDPLLVDVGKSFGASQVQLLKEVIIPFSMPAIFAGIRTGLGAAWMVVLAAEMIASTSGLGFLIWRGMESNDIALAIVGMIVIGVVGALLSTMLVSLERWLCPWRTYQQ